MLFTCPKCKEPYCSTACYDKMRHVARCPVSIKMCQEAFKDAKKCTNAVYGICPNPDVENSRRCGNCYGTYYCSAACQKADWPDHKLHCNEFLRGYNYFKINYPHIFMEHLYDILKYGHNVNECIRVFMPDSYDKYTLAQYLKASGKTRRQARNIVKALKKGLHVYKFCDVEKNINIISAAVPNVNDGYFEDAPLEVD